MSRCDIKGGSPGNRLYSVHLCDSLTAPRPSFYRMPACQRSGENFSNWAGQSVSQSIGKPYFHKTGDDHYINKGTLLNLGNESLGLFWEVDSPSRRRR